MLSLSKEGPNDLRGHLTPFRKHRKRGCLTENQDQFSARLPHFYWLVLFFHGLCGACPQATAMAAYLSEPMIFSIASTGFMPTHCIT